VLNGTFSMLEPCEVKISRRVLGGLGASNGPRLLDKKGAQGLGALASLVFTVPLPSPSHPIFSG